MSTSCLSITPRGVQSIIGPADDPGAPADHRNGRLGTADNIHPTTPTRLRLETARISAELTACQLPKVLTRGQSNADPRDTRSHRAVADAPFHLHRKMRTSLETIWRSHKWNSKSVALSQSAPKSRFLYSKTATHQTLRGGFPMYDSNTPAGR